MVGQTNKVAPFFSDGFNFLRSFQGLDSFLLSTASMQVLNFIHLSNEDENRLQYSSVL